MQGFDLLKRTKQLSGTRGYGLTSVFSLSVLLAQGTSRQALWLPVAFAIGTAAYFTLDYEPVVWLAPALMLVLALSIYSWRRTHTVALLMIFAMFVAAGFAMVQWRANSLAAPVIERKLPPVDLTGIVEKIDLRKGGLRVTLGKLSISRLDPSETPVKIRITSRFNQPELRPGDLVEVRAKLLPPPEAARPGGFDFVRRAWFQQIGAVGYSFGKLKIVGRAGESSWRVYVGELRQHVTQRVLQALSGDKISANLAAALMTGHRGGVPEDVVQALRDAGLAHLLAISGLHIGLLSGLIFFVSRALLALVEPVALRYPIKKIAAFLALAGAFVYLLMTGATAPTQRAFLMTGLVLVAVMLDRRAISMGLVAWAAGVVLVLSPESLTGPGFQMSFAAVVALIAVYERSQPRLSAWRRGKVPGRRVMLYVLGVALTTVVASLATSPVAVAHFGRLASWGLAANLIAVPVMALWIMPWALAAFVLMPFGLESWALAPMGAGINIVVDVAQTVAGWPGAVQILPAMPIYALAFMALGGLWICLNDPEKLKPAGFWPGGALIATGIVFWIVARPPVVMIDAGGRLYGVMAADGSLRVNNRRDSFTLRSWLAEQGLSSADSLRGNKGPGSDETSSSLDLQCDSLGCQYENTGQIIAIVHDIRALEEDCAEADAVISTVPLRKKCLRPSVRIDRFDLWREGAHALWIDDDGRMIVKSVAGERGERLWSPPRLRSTQIKSTQIKPTRNPIQSKVTSSKPTGPDKMASCLEIAKCD